MTVRKYIKKLLRESLVDFDITPPKVKTGGNGGDGNENYKVYVYYGELFIPKGFIGLLNDDVPGSEFMKELNGLKSTVPTLYDNTYFSTIIDKIGCERYVIDGYYKSLGEVDYPTALETYLSHLYTTMFHYNTGKTVGDDGIVELARSSKVTFDFRYREIVDKTNREIIMDRFF